MVQLEEKCRAYKARIKELKQSDSQSVLPREFTPATSSNLEVIPETTRFDELQRANLILMRAKESQYKQGQYIKNKYERRLMQMQVQLE